MSYPFDPSVRRRVADLLYDLLPSLYRIQDLTGGTQEPLKTAAPEGSEELYKFLHVLAAPLAELRQNIDELHADLFIDSCADWVLPYLADIVGMTLAFPDADSNRRDVRGTVGWRRRKGTPAMLQEMASDLAAQIAVGQEGWKRLAMTQDLNLPRPERTLASLVDAIVAEQASGPLDRSAHAVDPRDAPRLAGRFLPRHLTHWLFPTELFPLREGAPAVFVAPMGPHAPIPGQDLRYVFHPLGAQVPLRARRRDPTDPLLTDRVPPLHFAAGPGAWFDQSGDENSRFTVRLCGLPAAVARPSAEERAASAVPAGRALAAPDGVRILLLESKRQRLPGPVGLEVLDVPLVDAGRGVADAPDAAGARGRGELTLDDGQATFDAGSAAPVPGPAAVMLRLRPKSGSFTYFPGAVVEIASRAVDACLPSLDPELARRGFLRGALIVEVPATWVRAERWLYLGADGSLYDAQSPSAAEEGLTPDVPLAAPAPGRGLELPGEPLAIGPPPAWPPLPPASAIQALVGQTSAPGRGPVIVRGPAALEKSGDSYAPAGAVSMGLVFALRAGPLYRPFLRLDWTGADPTAASTFRLLRTGASGVAAAATAEEARQALKESAELARNSPDSELLVRLEAARADVVLAPCEVAFAGADGRGVLVYLPMRQTMANPLSAWPATDLFASAAVRVQQDGSTAEHPGGDVARFAYGPIAPLRGAATLRRRRLRYRNLCPWNVEDAGAVPPQMLAFTETGWLDVDPAAGLFAFSGADPLPAFPLSVEALGPPPPVTVDFQEGYSQHIGARPAAREPILGEALEPPTRLVLGNGRLHPGSPAAAHALPRYPTLQAALAAIASSPAASGAEVVQIEDSATYAGALAWPSNLRSLTLQATEGERPVIVLSGPVAGGSATYERFALRGIAFAAQGGSSLAFPPALDVRIDFCSALGSSDRWSFPAPAAAPGTCIAIRRSLAGGLDVSGRRELRLEDAVVDAASGRAIDAPDAAVRLERVTVATATDRLPDDPDDGFAVDVRVLEASECLFTGKVRARDPFHGCARYCRVAPGSRLPQRHKVGDDQEPRFATRDRFDPAHLRLAEHCPAGILRGAEDGSEMGAFHDTRLAQRLHAVGARLAEYTPAGQQTRLLRRD